MRDLNEMKYLERVVKEALRLYPSVPFIGRILKEDTKIGTSRTDPARNSRGPSLILVQFNMFIFIGLNIY
jgi:hypothetical protein